MSNKAEILNELESLSPSLHQLKQQGDGFKVPENYFEELKAEVFQSVELGFAEDIGKQNFAVPEGYFNKLTDNIMAAVDAEAASEVEEVEKPTPVIDIQSARRRKPMPRLRWVSMAAAVAGIIFFMTFLSNNINGGGEQPYAEVTSTEIYDYLGENNEGLYSEDLYAFVDLSVDDFSYGMEDFSDEDLENYLEELDDVEVYNISQEI